MERGDFVTVVLGGKLGKPRPALVVQAGRFGETTALTVLPITSTITDAPFIRIAVTPDDRNGLKLPSQIMVDKIMTTPREKVGPKIGVADDTLMVAVNRSLALFLGLT